MESDTTFNQVVYRPDAGNYASSYTIDDTTNAAPTTCTTVATNISGNGTDATHNFTALAGYVRLNVMTAVAGGAWGHAVREFEVYNQGGGLPIFSNAGFETPATSTYVYGPMTNGWTFDSGAGVHVIAAYGGPRQHKRELKPHSSKMAVRSSSP